MRFSLATVALVGLGNVLFSVNGAPASLSQRGSELDIPDSLAKRVFEPPKIPKIDPEPAPVPKPRPEPIEPAPAPVGHHGIDPVNPRGLSKPTTEELDLAIAKTYTPKPVPAFGGPNDPYPYTKSLVSGPPLGEDAKWGQVYTVSSPNYAAGKVYIDRVGINTDTNTISIFDAVNKGDKNQPLGKKLYLSDIIIGLFKQAGKNPTDLKSVHVDTVINTDSKTVFDAIYQSLGKDPEKDVLTFRKSATGDEKANFDKITNTPFGLAIDRANQEFSTGKTAQLYTLGPNAKDEEELDFDIAVG